MSLQSRISALITTIKTAYNALDSRVTVLEGAGGGGGGTVSRLVLQGLNDTTIPQDVTTEIVWTTTTKSDAGFTYNATTGEITIGSALDGVWAEFNVSMLINMGARTMLELRLQRDQGSGWNTIFNSSNYSTRNNNQPLGASHINGFAAALANGDVWRIQTYLSNDSSGASVVDSGCFLSIRTDPV